MAGPTRSTDDPIASRRLVSVPNVFGWKVEEAHTNGASMSGNESRYGRYRMVGAINERLRRFLDRGQTGVSSGGGNPTFRG